MQPSHVLLFRISADQKFFTKNLSANTLSPQMKFSFAAVCPSQISTDLDGHIRRVFSRGIQLLVEGEFYPLEAIIKCMTPVWC